MRHRKAGVKLNRTTSHRQAMFKNMVTSLFKHDRIRTTDVKAKELRRWADHIITLAKRGDLHARRQVLSIVQEKGVAHKLFEEAGKRFGAISGGYTRIIKLGRRPGDAAPVSIIELVSAEEKAKSKKKGKGAAKKKESVAPTTAKAPATPPEKAAKDKTDETKAEEKADALEAEAQPEQTDQSDADVQSAAVEGEVEIAEAEADAPAAEAVEPAAEDEDPDAGEPEKK